MTTALAFLRRSSALTLLLALAASASLVFVQPAAADELVKSDPPASETIAHAPETILLTFDEPLLLEPGANSAAIVDEEGVRVDDGQAEISGYSDRSLLVRPQYGTELEGEVFVAYVVTFASGESRTGAIEFTVDPEFEGGAEEPGGVSTPSTDQGIVLWTLAILAAVALFVSGGYYLRFATDNAKSSVEEPGDDQH
jgi:methionine-rich copper-binding protein CopC